MHNTLQKIVLSLLVCLVATGIPAAAQDTVSRRPDQRQHLSTVVVRRDKKPTPTLSQSPVQVVDMERLERSGALQLSDALKQMAGVTLRDYGGIGGMKTVSARGLGSQFSTLTIDGIAVNDCQNGQVDLGRYMLGGSQFISLTNGQEDDMLLTARATAAGNIINMESLEPQFMPYEHFHANVGLEGGSFGLFSPSLGWQQKLGKRTSLTFYGNYLRSNGNYPFKLYYTASHNDSSSIERREHSAMWLATGDLNLFYNISNSRLLTAKIHYVQGFHELPGPVVYYASKGSEDTKEKLFFTQAKYTSHHKRTSFQLIGKYQYTDDIYEDFRAMTVSRYLMNQYSQNEGYLSGSMLWKIAPSLTGSLATDGALTKLNSSLKTNSHVTRITSLSTVAIQFRHRRIDAKANLLATLVNEDACDNPSTVLYHKLSPYAGVSIRPFGKSRIRVRYFFKETYRVPNFNEMYYFVMPLDTLRPECATQHNIGITLPITTLHSKDSLWIRSYSLTIDGYRNDIKDKIIAIPRQNMFIWSTMNLGLVEITGLDVKGSLDWHWERFELNGTVTYSYQKAIDRTNPNDPKTYNNQIPYTPRHSGGVALYLKTPWLNMGYNIMAVGERYYQQQNNSESRQQPYADHSITLDRHFELPACDLLIQLQVLNLLDVQYEVVRSYPMMGRNFRIKAAISF